MPTTERSSELGGVDQEALSNNPQIERLDGISVIRGNADGGDWNGISYTLGINQWTVGSKELAFNVASVPPGGVAFRHIHVDFEVGLYILQGTLKHTYGPGLKKEVYNQAGDIIFIEPGVPHEVYNLSDTEPVVAVVARTDSAQWENIIPYDPDEDPDA